MNQEEKMKILSALPAEKHKALLKILQEKKKLHKVEGITKRPLEEEIYPSFSQERMWFLDKLTPSNSAYNIFLQICIKGQLDLNRLKFCINQVVKRQEVLRTKFLSVDGKLKIEIIPELTVNLDITDISFMDSIEQDKSITELALRESQKPFDLTMLPLFRTSIIKKNEATHILFITMHHIISDGWSMNIFLKEITQFYKAVGVQDAFSLSNLEYNYSDYAYCQRKKLEGEVLDSKLEFWKKYLQDSIFSLDLPLDKPRPSVLRNNGKRRRFSLSPKISASIRELCNEENVTLFTFLMTAFNVLLYKYTGQEDILIGTPVANRDTSEIEGLIGCFINTLVMRTNIVEADTFKLHLKRNGENYMEVLDQHDFPFDILVEKLHVARNLSMQPIFQVMLILQSAEMKSIEQKGLEFEIMRSESVTSKFDLTLELFDETSIAGWFEYNTDLFEDSTIDQLISSFNNLLDGIVTDCNQTIMELEVLTETDKHILLEQWNDTQFNYPDKNVILHFENQVLETPEAPALIFENQMVSYNELNTRINQLAHHLIYKIQGKQKVIGVLMERSIEMIISIYAILKSGCVYLPIDPDYPQERLDYLIEDSEVSIILTQERFENKLKQESFYILSVDTQWDHVDNESIENPINESKPEDVAYIIYTSGSTGKPKGVINTHKGLYNRMSWMQRQYRITHEDRMLQKTPFSFDVSLVEFFWPLLFGAGLVIAKPNGHKDSNYLINIIKEQKVTLIHFVPSMLRAFLLEDLIDDIILRKVFCSGEALTRDIQNKFFEKYKNVELNNLYGPTEAAVDVSSWRCEKNTKDSTIPIGRPIDNIQLYILDAHLKPVPIGVHGELYIGGVGVAKGYLNKHNLTKEKFISNPYDKGDSPILYKTGDLVKHIKDGNILYIGRNDFQVKIRGLRVELEEIESLILEYPNVHEAVVDVKTSNENVKMLVAYVVMESKKELDSETLKINLKKYLPEYMVPTFIIQMEKLPRLNNGKINRKALSVPDILNIMSKRTYIPPLNDIEKQLCSIWSKLLNLNQVSIQDRFFELGGDSILSIQVVARARQLGIQITPQQIFEFQTVEELSKVAKVRNINIGEQGIITGKIPLTPIQHWFFERKLEELNYFNQAILIKTSEKIEKEALKDVIGKLMIQHDALRIHFYKSDMGWTQINKTTEENIPLEWIEINDTKNIESVIETKAKSVQASLNISEGPIVKFIFFNIANQDKGYLLIVIHHLVIDGVSWRILIHDLQTLYRQPSTELVKTTSFKKYAEKLIEYCQDIPNGNDFKSYVEILKNIDEKCKYIENTHYNMPNTVSSVKSIEVNLDRQQTRKLLIEVNKVYKTNIEDLLLVALSRTFSTVQNKDMLLVDLESHGREIFTEDIDLSRTIGWFTNIFPVVLNLTEAKELSQSIKLVKEQVRDGKKNSLNYGIVKYLAKDCEEKNVFNNHPKAEILFNYLGQLDKRDSEDELFTLESKSIGFTQSEKQLRSHSIEINAHITEDSLRIYWNYSEHLQSEETIIKLIEVFKENLLEMIEHYSEMKAGFTPSDFPVVNLNQRQIDFLMDTQKDVEDIYPLTAMQEIVLAHNIYSRNKGNSIQQISWDIIGDLDVLLFKIAWKETIKNNPILRTSFVWHRVNSPLQVVHTDVDVEFLDLDWSEQTNEKQNELYEDLILNWGKRTFKVEQAPLMRFCIIKRAPGYYSFIWSYWTSLFDNWSWANVVNEVLNYYKQGLSNQDIKLKKNILFKDYLKWVMSQSKDEIVQFWVEEMEGFSGKIDLNIETKIQSTSPVDFKASENIFILPERDLQKMNTFVKNNSITLATILQGAWILTLSDYTGERDILYGILSNGRPSDLIGVESINGLLANDLPIRVKVDQTLKVKNWLKNIQDKNIKMRQYDYVSIPDISKWTNIPQEIFQKAIYERNFIFVKGPKDSSNKALDEDPISFTNFNNSLNFNVPLRIYIETGEQLSIKIKYNEAIYSESTIKAMQEKLYKYSCLMIIHSEFYIKDLLNLRER